MAQQVNIKHCKPEDSFITLHQGGDTVRVNKEQAKSLLIVLKTMLKKE